METKSPFPMTKEQPKFYNVLPIAYKTWLDFYDSIPEQYRQERMYSCLIEVNDEQYIQLYGEKPAPLSMNRAKYEISREWLLARVAEQMLPSRLTRENVNTLESALHQAGKYDSSDIFAKGIELLTPIWAVAKKK